MLLTSEYIITDQTGLLSKCAHGANNMYNAALYQVRQSFFKHRKFFSYNELDKLFKIKYQQRECMAYHEVGYVQSAQQTIKEVLNIWSCYFKALKAFYKNSSKFSGKPHIPSYLEKGNRHLFFVTNQSAKNKNGYLVIPKLGIHLKLDQRVKKIKQVALKPLSKQRFRILVQYEVSDSVMKPDNGVYIGIDPGLDNAFTCVTNGNQCPLIINGKGPKSVNQYYNKQRAILSRKHAQYHQCCKTINTKQGIKKIYYDSQKMIQLTEWRNTKIKQFAHKASKRIIDYALNCGANTIVIGKNKNQKRSANLGKRNNQNFIGIPHSMMINMIKYKAQQVGINVIETNESYTSQTSFLDHEKPCKQNGNYVRKQKHLSPAKRRVKRGLFRSNNGTLINADVNGALQIIKKVFPKLNLNDGIVGLVLSPFKYSINF